MCKTYCVGLAQILDDAVHPVIDCVLGHGSPPEPSKVLGAYIQTLNSLSDPLKVGGVGGVVAHVIIVSPLVPIGLGF